MREFQPGQKRWLWNGQNNFPDFQYHPKPFPGQAQKNNNYNYNRPQNGRSYDNGKFKPKEFNNKDDKKSWSGSSDGEKETNDTTTLMVCVIDVSSNPVNYLKILKKFYGSLKLKMLLVLFTAFCKRFLCSTPRRS